MPITALISTILFAGIFKVEKALSSPFQYPYFEMSFDVSGKRNPDIEDYIDYYLIENGFDAIEEHHNKTIAWKKECEEQLQNSMLKNTVPINSLLVLMMITLTAFLCIEIKQGTKTNDKAITRSNCREGSLSL